MVQLRPIALTLGLLLCVLAAAMLLPGAVAGADGSQDWPVFVASAAFTLFIGGLLVAVGYNKGPIRLGLREGFVLTTLSWVVVTSFAAVPFTGLGLTYADAFFEAMSGLTTTGATVLVGLDGLPRGILLWRALLHGIGGLGIVVMAILILPYLSIGGMQLFQMESSDRSEKVAPRAAGLMMAISGVYVGLIAFCTISYVALGMTFFDAVCHALATISTGGFSTHDASFGFFASPSLEMAGTLFMALGAFPFVVLIKAMHGDLPAVWRDAQVRGFVSFLAVISLLLGIWLALSRDLSLLTALRMVAFNVTSVVTTTGFASTDYNLWGPFAVSMFFLLTFVGGCTGSTAGGIKIYRLQMAGMLTRGYLLNLISPNRVVTLVFNGRRVPEDVPFSVIAFLAVYMATVGIVSVVLTAMDLDFVTALTSAATALGNVGPGLGEIVGPAGNFATLPAAAKWTLSFTMLLGRLELFTVLVLFRPEFWR
ncbi:MAG: TrkH family potassium uptake protein [Hyphomicrobiaceae bacterium]|nr:TrkH family potassium uptake protein [Hyphomicrobiaceae bacterium]